MNNKRTQEQQEDTGTTRGHRNNKRTQEQQEDTGTTRGHRNNKRTQEQQEDTGTTRGHRNNKRTQEQQEDTGTTRGHSEKLHVQRTTGQRHTFFSTRVINAWNSLSEDTIQTTTVNHIKSKLRREWKDHPDLYSYHFTKQTNRNNNSDTNSTKSIVKNVNNANKKTNPSAGLDTHMGNY